MRRLLLALLLSVPSFAAETFYPPTPGELALTDVAWAPGAPAVILDWSVSHNDEESSSTEYVRIKVLTEEGKKYANVEILSIPRLHVVTSIEARTTNGTNPPVPFDGRVYEKPVAKRRRFKLLQKNFTLPDVQVGSILEYRYTITWPQTQLRPGRWTLQREIPIVKAEFTIRPHRHVPSVATTKGLPQGLVPVKLHGRYYFSLEKVAAYAAEPFAPPELEAKPRLQFFYTSGGDYWMEVAHGYSKAVEEFIGNRSGIRKAAAQIVGNLQDEDAKLRAIYARVQRLRNVDFKPEEKARDHHDAEDVLRAGYGTRAELNRLFVALARAAGFDARIALVPARDEVFFTRELPDATQLDAELAVVKDRFFDPGTPHAPSGLLSWENTAVPALRLTPKASGSWLVTPGPALGETSRVAELVLREGTLTGTATITYRGQDALVQRLAAAEGEKFEDELKTLFGDGAAVKVTKVEGLEGSEEPLAVTFEVELPNLASQTTSRALVPLSVFTASARNQFAAEQRLYPIYFPYHQQVEDRVILRVPAGYTIESLPKAVTLDKGGIGYSAEWKAAGSAITFERRRTIKTIAVAPAEYKTLRNFFGDAANADAQPVVLKKTGL